jgi:RNA polymerase sigma factor (sigma-70 family)
MGMLLERLRQSAGLSALSDAALLERFAAQRDEGAFAALVERFGPMVLGVCRRILGDEHAAEDAFQAVFLVLARKAASLVRQDLVGNWLWGVAYRTARRAKVDAARWHKCRREVRSSMAPDPVEELAWRDVRPVLDAEIDRLPAKYRQPFVLCYLEGRTNEEAARRLGWPAGTVFTRLARAREILRGRLTRCGVTLSAVALIGGLKQEASARVAAGLARSTARAAMLFADGSAPTCAALSPRAATLAAGTLRSLVLDRLQVAAGVLVALAMLGSAGALLSHRGQTDAGAANAALVAQVAQRPAAKPPSPAEGGAVAREETRKEADPPEDGFGLGFGMGPNSATATVMSGKRQLRVTVYGSRKLAALADPVVQQTLGLTTQQRDQVRRFQTSQRRAMEALVPPQPVTARQAPTVLRDLEGAPYRIAKLTREIDTALDAMLTDQQRQRLPQIVLPKWPDMPAPDRN